MKEELTRLLIMRWGLPEEQVRLFLDDLIKDDESPEKIREACASLLQDIILNK